MNENESLNPDLNNQNNNYNILNLHDFKSQNPLLSILQSDNNSSLNNNYLSSPLIFNINSEKELDNLNNLNLRLMMEKFIL